MSWHGVKCEAGFDKSEPDHQRHRYRERNRPILSNESLAASSAGVQRAMLDLCGLRDLLWEASETAAA